ncbi:MAG: NADPH:quinone oxidoreductase family protein [Pseudomonadota bacterium]
MRALVCNEYGGADKLRVEERDTPEPGPGQLLVAVRAAGLNFPDVLIVAGRYQVKTPPPFVPGNEAAGVVTAIGDGVTRFKAGDAILCTPTGGAFAQACVVDEAMAMPMVKGLDFPEAAGFAITYGTGLHALVQGAALAAGETLLVLGAAGGAGSAAVELGKALGARVIAAASSDEKLAFARERGADDTINYRTDDLRDAVKALTDGRGADVVFDPVGGDLALAALRATAWHGRYLVIGFASGDIPAFPANLALLKEARIVGVWWGTWASRNPREHVGNMTQLATLLAEGTLSPTVTERYALDDYVAAFGAITERRAMGKVVFVVDGDD